MNYEQIYKSESLGSFNFGIDIKIASPTDIKSDGIRHAAYQAAELLEQAITRDFYANNKEAQERALIEKVDLINCFPEYPIFVRPIPNQYCSRACCEHLPWFQVTCRFGIITIGWCKRVIQIDWTDSTLSAEAKELFPAEDVTKDGRMIHAWSLEKAKEYIAVLYASAKESGDAV